MTIIPVGGGLIRLLVRFRGYSCFQESTIPTDELMVSDAERGVTNTDVQVHERAAENSHAKGITFRVHASDFDVICSIQASIRATICPKAELAQTPCQSCTGCAT